MEMINERPSQKSSVEKASLFNPNRAARNKFSRSISSIDSGTISHLSDGRGDLKTPTQ